MNSSSDGQPPRYELQGSVWGYEDSARVIVQLIDAKENGTNLWAGVYERRITDRFVHRDLAQEINAAVADVLDREVLPKPAPVVESKPSAPPPAAAQPKKQPDVLPRQIAAASAKRATETFARAIANRTAKSQYGFGASVLKEIRSFAGDESNMVDVSVSGFKVREYQPDRIEADLLLIIKQRSGNNIESLPLPFRATVTRSGTTWHLTAFQRR